MTLCSTPFATRMASYIKQHEPRAGLRGLARHRLLWPVVCLSLLAGHQAAAQRGQFQAQSVQTAGSSTTCVLLQPGGRVKCWGRMQSGSLGNGDPPDARRSPAQLNKQPPIELAGPATQIAVGMSHVCAILEAGPGSLQCWGSNSAGQLGFDDTQDRGVDAEQMGTNLPLVNLGTGAIVTQVAVGLSHSCALLQGGTVKCWGRGSSGQLGGTNETRGDKPGSMGDALPSVSLPPGTTAIGIAAGAEHTCILLSDQSVVAFGSNAFGELGRGDAVQSWGTEPWHMGENLRRVNLGTGKSAIQIAAGSRTTCGLLNDGSVKCWGDVRYEPDPFEILLPALNTGVIPSDRLIGTAPEQMGDNLAVSLGPEYGATQISVGDTHVCARLSNQSVVCFGGNRDGELGVEDARKRLPPEVALVKLPPTVEQVSAGDSTTCAVQAGGAVNCWGWLVTADAVGDMPGDMEQTAVDLGPVPIQPPPPSPPPAPAPDSPSWFLSPPLSRLPPLSLDTSAPSSSGLQLGVIIGATVGGLVLLAPLLIVACVCIRRRSATRHYPPMFPVATNATFEFKSSPDSPDIIKEATPQCQGDFTWVLPGHQGHRVLLQAGVNDVDLDTAKQVDGQGWVCPVQSLSSAEVKAQIKLLAGKPLGTGACGQVFKCTWDARFPGALLAAKVMQNENEHVLKSFSYEAQLLAAIRHPNIVRVYGYCLESPTVCIIMELLNGSVDDQLRAAISGSCKNSALADSPGLTVSNDDSRDGVLTEVARDSSTSAHMIQAADTDATVTIQLVPIAASTKPGWDSSNPPDATGMAAPSPPSALSPGRPGAVLSMSTVLSIAMDVSAGLEYLHHMHVPLSIRQQVDTSDGQDADLQGRMGVLHRDLKPANILLDRNGLAKICDFGIARRVEATVLHTAVEWAGTTAYMAPELLAVRNNQNMRGMVTRKVDIYSLGIILCELLCRSRALMRPDQVLCGIRPVLPTLDEPEWRSECLSALQCSTEQLDSMIDLISKCWHHRSEVRPTASQVRAQLAQVAGHV